MHDALDAILDERDVEVDEIAQVFVGELQLGNQLRVVCRGKTLSTALSSQITKGS